MIEHSPDMNFPSDDRTRSGDDESRDGLRRLFEVVPATHGVEVRYCDEDNSGPPLSEGLTAANIGTAIRRVFGAIYAVEECKKLNRRVTGGMRDKVMQGFYPGSEAPFGTVRWGEAVHHIEAKSHGDAPILYRDFMEDPPVSRELFAEVQEALESRAVYGRPAHRHYSLSSVLTSRNAAPPGTATRPPGRPSRNGRTSATTGPLSAGTSNG